MNMSVHKLIFFCWLVATCSVEPTSSVKESTTDNPPTTSVMRSAETTESSTQKPMDTPTTPTPSETTTSSVQESSRTSSTDPTVTHKTQTTATPSEVTSIPVQESSSTPIITTTAQSNTAPSATEPTATTQKSQETQNTPKPSETTTSPVQGSSSTPIIDSTTEAQSNTVTSASKPTATTTGDGSPGTSTDAPSPSSSPKPEVTVSSGTQATSQSGTSITPDKTTPTEPSTETKAPATTTPPACSSNPCPFDSICIELAGNFTCQCIPGSFYSDGSCRKAKVFAGDLRVIMDFKEGMENPESPIFKTTAKQIVDALGSALRKNPSYIESRVLELRSGSVIASVDNIYQLNSATNQKSFEADLKESIDCNNCGLLGGAEFNDTDLCQMKPKPCDLDTTECYTSDGIVSCPCQTGYIRSNFSQRSCSACPSGQKAKDNACVKCPFGYSGFNCNDSSLLAVVVISCVLGGLLLILLLAFIIYGSRTKKKDYSSPYPPAQETRTTWSNDNIPKIPRASANISAQWDPTQLEMTESGSTRALVTKERPGNGMMGSYDDMRTFTSKNQSRYSYLVQGQDNPHFISDDGRGTK